MAVGGVDGLLCVAMLRSNDLKFCLHSCKYAFTASRSTKDMRWILNDDGLKVATMQMVMQLSNNQPRADDVFLTGVTTAGLSSESSLSERQVRKPISI